MSIDLKTFASGDTDYIAKLNSNVSNITAAINALQTQAGAAGAGGGAPLSSGMFFVALFNNADALIGPGAYKPTPSGTNLSIAAGGMYIAQSQTLATLLAATTLNFAGQTAGTKYINIDNSGLPVLATAQGSGSAYSVQWSGTGFTGQPVRLAPAFYDTVEADASRNSTSLANNYGTLDLRLEAGEIRSKTALDKSQTAIDIANDVSNQLTNVIQAAGAQKFRKVGLTIDGTAGNKGAIQLDFYGTIVGWSVIADQVGALQVEVSKKASSPPPAAPALPNIVTDKISASAPVQLSAAQTASRAEAGVSTWTTKIVPWDVMQFNVVVVTTITRATLYIRIQEEPPIQPLSSVFISSTSQATAPILVA